MAAAMLDCDPIAEDDDVSGSCFTRSFHCGSGVGGQYGVGMLGPMYPAASCTAVDTRLTGPSDGSSSGFLASRCGLGARPRRALFVRCGLIKELVLIDVRHTGLKCRYKQKRVSLNVYHTVPDCGICDFAIFLDYCGENEEEDLNIGLESNCMSLFEGRNTDAKDFNDSILEL